jgi:non-ribosomal peptide synthetase component E (peptide arylation enzyme)
LRNGVTKAPWPVTTRNGAPFMPRDRRKSASPRRGWNSVTEHHWEDRPLFDGFTAALAAYADRVAVVDETGPVTYRQLSERSERLARALLDVGLRPLDRVIVQLPNTAVFVYLYFALQQIGAVPVLALPGHRKREITQFAEISGATALAGPAAARGFDFLTMAADVMTDRPDLRLCLVQGLHDPPNDPRFLRLEDLLAGEPRSGGEALEQISIDPADPALFLLSGGTTGIPKLIPRTHNDYLYNSKLAAEGLRHRRRAMSCCLSSCRSRTTCRSPARAFRASCCQRRAPWCSATSTRSREDDVRPHRAAQGHAHPSRARRC